MANTSEQFINATVKPDECMDAIYFGFTLWYTVATFCFLFSTPAQLWCFWFYICTDQKIKETRVFLLSYTMMEFIYCLECGLEPLNTYIIQDDTLWDVIYFLFGLSWIGRPLLQTCICIEQYLAVVHPVTFLKYKGIKYRIAAAVVASLMAAGYGVYAMNVMIFPDYIFIFVFAITIAVISFCCLSVLRALKHPGPGNSQIRNQTGGDVGNQQKRNAFNTIFSGWLLILITCLSQVLLIFFAITGVNHLLFVCEIIPSVCALNVLGVIITPWLKLYKEYHIKCLQNQKEMKVTPSVELKNPKK